MPRHDPLVDTPEARRWLRQVERELFPKLEDSVMSLTIYDGHVDPKLCVELGALILYDKPIIILALTDAPIPAALQRVADAIVRGDPLTDPTVQQRLADTLQSVLKKRGIST
jgi:hypothetical protein